MMIRILIWNRIRNEVGVVGLVVEVVGVHLVPTVVILKQRVI